MAGTKQVALGDLVYCKGDDTEKLRSVVSPEFEDDECNDAFVSSNFDEISETDLPEERNSPVKVRCLIIYHSCEFLRQLIPIMSAQVVFSMPSLPILHYTLASAK